METASQETRGKEKDRQAKDPVKSEIKEEVTEQTTTEDSEKRVKYVFCVAVDWCLWRRAGLEVFNASNFRCGSLVSSLGHSIALFFVRQETCLVLSVSSHFKLHNQPSHNFGICRLTWCPVVRQRPLLLLFRLRREMNAAHVYTSFLLSIKHCLTRKQNDLRRSR